MASSTVTSNNVSSSEAVHRKKTGFDQLPGELRNRIYRMALVDDKPILVRVERKPAGRTVDRGKGKVFFVDNLKLLPSKLANVCAHSQDDKTDKPMNIERPGVLLASRQTHEEASPIYYFENSFSFTEPAISQKAIKAFSKLTGTTTSDLKPITIHRELLSPWLNRATFKIKTTAVGNLDVEVVRVNIPDLLMEDHGFHNPDSVARVQALCVCDLLKISGDISNSTSNTKVLDFLQAYAFTVAGKWHPVRAPTCKGCGKTKFI